jgi:exodeoxyribonuclease VII small subunit
VTDTENTSDTQDDSRSATQQPAIASSLSDKERDAIAKLPYEQARDQLIQAVQSLEAGGLDLDASMHQWEIGEALSKRAQELLDQVRAKLDAAQAQQASAGATAGTQSNIDPTTK